MGPERFVRKSHSKGSKPKSLPRHGKVIKLVKSKMKLRNKFEMSNLQQQKIIRISNSKTGTLCFANLWWKYVKKFNSLKILKLYQNSINNRFFVGSLNLRTNQNILSFSNTFKKFQKIRWKLKHLAYFAGSFQIVRRI